MSENVECEEVSTGTLGIWYGTQLYKESDLAYSKSLRLIQ